MRRGPYPFAIVGESFRNDDGSSRQAEIARCYVGEPVCLVRDPANRYDCNCIRVVSCRGVQIGVMAREHAEWLAGIIDDGSYCEAVILGGGQATNGLFGVNLLVSLDEAEPPIAEKFLAGEYPNQALPL